MKLYHGSYMAIEKPDLKFARRETDFGKGFYLTPIKAQVRNWAIRFIKDYGAAVVSSYDYAQDSIAKLFPELKVLEFEGHTKEWLDFVTSCRLGLPVDTKWDLVTGGVADDKVFDTLQLYFDAYIGKREAINRLRYKKPNFQYCFKNQALIDTCLKFTGAEVLK